MLQKLVISHVWQNDSCHTDLLVTPSHAYQFYCSINSASFPALIVSFRFLSVADLLYLCHFFRLTASWFLPTSFFIARSPREQRTKTSSSFSPFLSPHSVSNLLSSCRFIFKSSCIIVLPRLFLPIAYLISLFLLQTRLCHAKLTFSDTVFMTMA